MAGHTGFAGTVWFHFHQSGSQSADISVMYVAPNLFLPLVWRFIESLWVNPVSSVDTRSGFLDL